MEDVIIYEILMTLLAIFILMIFIIPTKETKPEEYIVVNAMNGTMPMRVQKGE